MTDLIDPPQDRVRASDLDPSPTADGNTSASAISTTVARGTAHWWRDGFHPLLTRLHFYAGMFVGPFVLVAAITGLLYAMTPPLEQIVHGAELRVPIGTSVAPLATQVDTARAAVPAGELIEVRPARTADGTTRVTFATDDVAPDHARTVFIDPYTGEIRGILPTFGEWLPVRSWFDALHRNLHLGDIGRTYSELAASWLWVLGVSGLAIWVARRRHRSRLRRTLVPQTRGSGRTRLLSWHATVGLWAVLGLLFLSVTGLTWSQFAGANFSQVRAQLNWATPTPDPTLPAADSGAVAPDQLGFTTERVLDAARAGGLDGPVAVTPSADGAAWTVAQVQRSWPVKQDAVTVDPTTGKVLDRVDFADWPVVGQLAEWGVDAHMGLLFGLANQLILAGLALGLTCMVVWGYRMWWRRRPPTGRRRGQLDPPGPTARSLTASPWSRSRWSDWSPPCSFPCSGSPC